MSSPFGNAQPLLSQSWAPSQRPAPTRPRTPWELLEERLAAYRLQHNLPPDWRPQPAPSSLLDNTQAHQPEDLAQGRALWEGLAQSGAAAAHGDWSQVAPSIIMGLTQLGMGQKALTPESPGTWDNGVPRNTSFSMPTQSSARGGVEAGRLARDWGSLTGAEGGPTLLPRGVAGPGQTQAPTPSPGARFLSLPPEMRPMIQADNDLAAANAAARARRSDWIRPSTPGRYPNPGPQVSPTPVLPDLQDSRYPVSGYEQNRMPVESTVPYGPPTRGPAALAPVLAARRQAQESATLAARSAGINPTTGQPAPPDLRPVLNAEDAAIYEAPLSTPFKRPGASFVRHTGPLDPINTERYFPTGVDPMAGDPINDVGQISPQYDRTNQPATPAPMPSTPSTGRLGQGVPINAPNTGEVAGGQMEWQKSTERYNKFVETNQSNPGWRPMLSQLQFAAEEAAKANTDPAYVSRVPAVHRQIGSAMEQLRSQLAVLEPQLADAERRAIIDPNGRVPAGQFGQESMTNAELETHLGTLVAEAYDTQHLLLQRFSRMSGIKGATRKAPTSETPSPADSRTAGFQDAGWVSGRPTTQEEKRTIGSVRFDAPPYVGHAEATKRKVGTPVEVGNFGPGFPGGTGAPLLDDKGKPVLDFNGKPAIDTDAKPLTVGELDRHGHRTFDPANPSDLASIAHATKPYQDGDFVPAHLGHRIIQALEAAVGPNRRSATLTLLRTQVDNNKGRGAATVQNIGTAQPIGNKPGMRSAIPTQSTTTTRPYKGNIQGFPDLGADVARVYLESGLAKTKAEANKLATQAMLAFSKGRPDAKSGPGYDAVQIGGVGRTSIAPRTMAPIAERMQRDAIAARGRLAAARRIETTPDKWKPSTRPLLVSFNFQNQPTYQDIAPYLKGTKVVRLISGKEPHVAAELRARGIKVELIPLDGNAIKAASVDADALYDPAGGRFDGVQWFRATGGKQLGLFSAKPEIVAPNNARPMVPMRKTTKPFGKKPAW